VKPTSPPPRGILKERFVWFCPLPSRIFQNSRLHIGSVFFFYVSPECDVGLQNVAILRINCLPGCLPLGHCDAPRPLLVILFLGWSHGGQRSKRLAPPSSLSFVFFSQVISSPSHSPCQGGVTFRSFLRWTAPLSSRHFLDACWTPKSPQRSTLYFPFCAPGVSSDLILRESLML